MQNSIVQFLCGKNFDTSIPFKPGTFYLDIEKKELWFDDPSNSGTEHNKIIDVSTLIYNWNGEVEYGTSGTEDRDIFDSSVVVPPVTSGTTAVLGTAVLGTMKLGTS